MSFDATLDMMTDPEIDLAVSGNISSAQKKGLEMGRSRWFSGTVHLNAAESVCTYQPRYELLTPSIILYKD